MRSRSKQPGVTVGECVVALAILGAMLMTLLSVQALQSARIRLDNQRLRAEQSLGNLADRILVADSTQLTDATLAAWADETEHAEALPADTIQVVVHNESEPMPGRRFELVWQPESKHVPRHRLVFWRFDAAKSYAKEEQP